MKKIDIPTKDSFLLEINTYYPQEIDGSKPLKSCKHKRFNDINSLIKYKHRAETYDPNVRCRVYIDITEASAFEVSALKTAINSVYGLTAAKKTKLNMDL